MADTDTSFVLLTYGNQYSEGKLTGAPGEDGADKTACKERQHLIQNGCL